MRNTVTRRLIPFILFLGFLISPVQHGVSQAKLVLETTEMNLGEIYNGAIVKAKIPLKSVGTLPLKILRINTSCGCTTVKEPRSEITPGKTDVLEVEFNSAGFSGKAVKYVYIESNDPENQYTTVTLTATVKEEFQPVRNYSLIWFGDVPVGKRAEQTYVLRNVSSSSIAIKGISATSKALAVSYDQNTVAPRDSLTLTVTVVPDKSGYMNEMFFVETGSKNQKRIPVRISLMGVNQQ